MWNNYEKGWEFWKEMLWDRRFSRPITLLTINTCSSQGSNLLSKGVWISEGVLFPLQLFGCFWNNWTSTIWLIGNTQQQANVSAMQHWVRFYKLVGLLYNISWSKTQTQDPPGSPPPAERTESVVSSVFWHSKEASGKGTGPQLVTLETLPTSSPLLLVFTPSPFYLPSTFLTFHPLPETFSCSWALAVVI